MAVKKYVSIMELLGYVSDVLAKKDGEVPMECPDYSEVRCNYGKKPFEFLDQNNMTQTHDKGDHPLDAFRQQLIETEAEDALPQETEEFFTRMVRLRRRVSPRFYDGVYVEIPYFLEMEFLKRSDFSLTEAEWELVEQMMVLQLITWYETKMDGSFTLSLKSGDLLELLTTDGYIHEFDLEEEPDKMTEIMETAYEKFDPMKTSYSNYRQKHFRNWFAAPVSSKDALMILHEMKTCRGNYWNDMAIYSEYLLFIPLIMTFSVLEKDTKTFLDYNYKDFMAYKSLLPALESEESNEECDNFSYGYINFSMRSQAEMNLHDKRFVSKILRHICKRMQELAVSHNIPTISVNELTLLFQPEIEKASILLNSADLTWEKEDLP